MRQVSKCRQRRAGQWILASAVLSLGWLAGPATGQEVQLVDLKPKTSLTPDQVAVITTWVNQRADASAELLYHARSLFVKSLL